MNKNFWLVTLMTAVLAGTSLTAYAQDDPAPKGDPDQPAMGRGMDNGGPGGGWMGGGHLGKLKEKLGLTDDQISKIKDLFKSQREAMTPLKDQMKIDMAILQQKVDTKASDGDLKKLLDKLDGEQKQMQASREKMKDQMRSILTPTQQAKFVLGMKKRGGMMRGKMGKGRPGWGKKGTGGKGPAPDANGGNDGQ